MSIKVLLSVAGTIGVGGITSLALLKTDNLDSTVASISDTSITSSDTSPANYSGSINTELGVPTEVSNLNSSSAEDRDDNGGNCVVIDTLGEDIFRGLGISKERYTAISCEKTDSKDSEEKLFDNWKGIFPNEFLIKDESLEAGTRFNIVTKTVEDEEEYGEYKTTFTGNSFFYYLVGKWDWGKIQISEKSITEVKVEESEGTYSSNSIYLLFPIRQNR